MSTADLIVLNKVFPSGIAEGESFINRHQEKRKLKESISSHAHSVIMAPRRYGKTSLVTKVSTEMNMPSCSIDLLAAYNIEYVRDQIHDKVGNLVFDLLPKIKKAQETLLSIFKAMKPEISISGFGQKLKIDLAGSPELNISNLLLKVDEVATHFNKRAIIFIDEFQQIAELKNYHSIEASIRHAVERSKNITYIFSGSNRHLLSLMFGDSGRPLYKLCDIIVLERISKEHYHNRLRMLAKKRWEEPLSEAVFLKIVELTELHPYYMNIICRMLWQQNNIPGVDDVIEKWTDYVSAQRLLISNDIMSLSLNQRQLLLGLLSTETKEILSNRFIGPLNMPTSSAQQSIEALINKDIVYRSEDGVYRVVDPSLKYYLLNNI